MPALCANALAPTYGERANGEMFVISLIACAIRVSSGSPPGSPSVTLSTGSPYLSSQVGDDGQQVGVAGALAVPVDGALDVRAPGLDRGERVGDRAAGVVVRVDAEDRRRARRLPGSRARSPRPRWGPCRRWCRTGRPPRRRPRTRRARRRASTPGRTGSRRRSARRRPRPGAPRAPGTRRCPRSSRGSRRRWSAARARRAAGRAWRRARRPAPRSRPARAPAGRRPRACPALRVLPNAASSALRKSSSLAARLKNSVSLGTAPGQPPSMKPTPSSSSSGAMASLSATERFMPSCWAPSRRVVS